MLHLSLRVSYCNNASILKLVLEPISANTITKTNAWDPGPTSRLASFAKGVKATIIRGSKIGPFQVVSDAKTDAFTASSYYNMDIRHVVRESGANVVVRVLYAGTKMNNENKMSKPSICCCPLPLSSLKSSKSDSVVRILRPSWFFSQYFR